MSNIKSVTYVGLFPTVDLEVDHPDHQYYLANGVLTSNSHAVAYAIDSYWCAWLMTYYEPQWISAYLESMSNSPDAKAKAFGEARALGYQIVPVDINYAGTGWTVLPGKKLMPSLTSVKGVGDTAVEEIIALRPFSSFEELLYTPDGQWRLSKFNRKALEALIKVRALDSLNAVGEGKLFASYRHMYETVMGSYTENVPQRKGSTVLVEKTRDHLTLIKRASKGNPHEGRNNLYSLARGLRDEFGEEWSHRELAQFQSEYFGTADVTMMFPGELFKKLEEKQIPSIESVEQGEVALAWFVTTLVATKKGAQPVPGIQKTTKNGKSYIQAYVTGPSGKLIRVNVWGQKELLTPYQLCVAEVKRDDFGFSTTPWKLKVIS